MDFMSLFFQSESAESCFNWLSTMRPRSISSAEEDRMITSVGSGTGANLYPSDEAQAEAQRSGSDSSDDEVRLFTS